MVTAVACARVPKFTVVIGGSFGAGQLRDVRPRLLAPLPVDVAQRADLGHGRRAGRRVLATVRRDQLEARGETWSRGARRSSRRRSATQYEDQGNPYYSTARLWDDGDHRPADTRRVLGLALSAAANAPLEPVGYGVFRM